MLRLIIKIYLTLSWWQTLHNLLSILISHPHTHTHTHTLSLSEIDSRRSSVQQLPSADSSLLIALSSHHILWEYPASPGLLPTPTAPWEMPYKGIGKSSPPPPPPPPHILPCPILPISHCTNSKYPFSNPENLFRNTLDALSRTSPSGILGILIHLTSKLKVQTCSMFFFMHVNLIFVF